MVDVSGKDVTARIGHRDRHGAAVGRGRGGAAGGHVPKGDALAVARIAGDPGREADART